MSKWWVLQKQGSEGNVWHRMHFREEERSLTSNLCLHLRELEKGEPMKSRVSKRKELVRIRVKIMDSTKGLH